MGEGGNMVATLWPVQKVFHAPLGSAPCTRSGCDPDTDAVASAIRITDRSSTSWAFSERVRQAGLVSPMGTVGDAFDNAVIESFWARLQTEPLNRKKWKTRVKLSTALFEYLEIFHNRTRRHNALAMLTPIEYENVNNQTAAA
jgi:putative transposase